MGATGNLADIDPQRIVANPENPRRFFNEERLDILRTSIQEVGVLVPIIVYEESQGDGNYVLMDGERRWRCSLDLAMPSVPANVIEKPSELDNLLRMFNIHNVREDWPLISVALSLQSVMRLSGEDGEKRLAEITGLTRSTVRRAKRILSLPDPEIELIRDEAHLDRSKQVHREDLYLEIEAAESVLRNELPEAASKFTRAEIIRNFASKAESGSLNAVTDFRFVSKLVKAASEGVVDRAVIVESAVELIQDTTLSPRSVFEDVAATAYKSQSLQRKSELLADAIKEYFDQALITDSLRTQLTELRDLIDEALQGGAQ